MRDEWAWYLAGRDVDGQRRGQEVRTGHLSLENTMKFFIKRFVPLTKYTVTALNLWLNRSFSNIINRNHRVADTQKPHPAVCPPHEIK